MVAPLTGLTRRRAGATGLTGLTGMYGRDVPRGEAVRSPDQYGPPLDPRHGVPGDAYPMPTAGDVVSTADPVEGGPIPDARDVWPGSVIDHTPSSHAAPYPKGITHDHLAYAETAGPLHGTDLGGVAAATQVPPASLETVGQADDPSPNTSWLQPVPGQLRVGQDVDQGGGRELGHGFNFGRLLRRWMRDPVPVDMTGTGYAARPWYGHHELPDQSGWSPDSQYGPQGDMDAPGNQLSATPSSLPTPYEAPPEPGVAPVTGYASEAPSLGGGWA